MWPNFFGKLTMHAIVSRGTPDTIAAIATPIGRGGIGVVRISGVGTDVILRGILGKPLATRHATFCAFLDGDRAIIDQGVALYFSSPHSYTGEDVLELQGHGGSAVMARILKRCLELGARLARPGEFTERAFLNDKLDLAQAESVADLIDASSEAAAKSAARTLTGEFSRRVHELTAAIVDLRLHVEACIDFPEEEIDPIDCAMQKTKLQQICSLRADLAREARLGVVLRDGLTVALIGRPNVGKSSLLNRLAGDEVAIVTPIAGTTRDHVRATIHLDGVPIHLIDTAGLRETDDAIEKIGIARTWAAIETAGAALLIMEAGEMAGQNEAEIMQKLPNNLPRAWVYNKIDLFEPSGVSRGTSRDGNDVSITVSALTGEGIDLLRRWLLDTAGWHCGDEGVFLARERHMAALGQAEIHLEQAGVRARQYELFAEELRLAQQALSSITGAFTSDDLLGEIFSRFCIGK